MATPPHAIGKERRTDEHLGQEVYDAIQKLGYVQLSRIDCEVDNSTVTLRGLIESFYLKQIAQTVAAKVPGIEQVRNELDVIQSPVSKPR